MTLRRRMKNYLLTGAFIVGPATLSLVLLFWFVSTVDRLVTGPLEGWLGAQIPGIGIVIAIILLVLVGVLASSIIGRHFLEFLEDILLKIPVFNWLYKIVKQLTDAFNPSSRLKFKSVVLVEFPSPGRLSLGFVTSRLHLSLPDGKKKELSCVYVPTNHLYIGNSILVPNSELQDASLSLQEGVQAVLSAGASLPETLNAKAHH